MLDWTTCRHWNHVGHGGILAHFDRTVHHRYMYCMYEDLKRLATWIIVKSTHFDAHLPSFIHVTAGHDKRWTGEIRWVGELHSSVSLAHSLCMPQVMWQWTGISWHYRLAGQGTGCYHDSKGHNTGSRSQGLDIKQDSASIYTSTTMANEVWHL